MRFSLYFIMLVPTRKFLNKLFQVRECTKATYAHLELKWLIKKIVQLAKIQ